MTRTYFGGVGLFLSSCTATMNDYHQGLLYLVTLLIDADGIADEKELEALHVIRDREMISAPAYLEFQSGVKKLKARDIYEKGISLISRCTPEEKLRAFATLYRLSEVDGRVHVKEIKLLLYSIKSAGVEFEAVVDFAKSKLQKF